MNANALTITLRWDMERAGRILSVARWVRWLPERLVERPLTFLAALAVLRTFTIEGSGRRLYSWRNAFARAWEMAR